MKGLYRYLQPFSSDMSGAAAVFYAMGGVVIIVDAGGCAGNISGFDERRFFDDKAALVFSACLRDMDAILGRDERLVEKTAKAVHYFPNARFVAYIGTPVPAVIGTDFHALVNMAEKRLGIPVVAVDTTGIATYEYGEVAAYKALISKKYTAVSGDGRTAATNACSLPLVFVWGATPLEMAAGDSIALLHKRLEVEYPNSSVIIVGELGSWSAVNEAMSGVGEGQSNAEAIRTQVINLAVSPSGLAIAKYLHSVYGTPYKVISPLDKSCLPYTDKGHCTRMRVLILHQQCMANAVRDILRPYCDVIRVATFFGLDKSIAEDGDERLDGEDEFIQMVDSNRYDVIIGDPLLRRAVLDFAGQWVALPHWAVSGQLYAVKKEAQFMEPIVQLAAGFMRQ